MIEAAKLEAEEIREKLDEQTEEIIDAVLPKNDTDGRNCTLEVM